MAHRLDIDGGFLRPYQVAAVVRFAEGAAAGHRRQIIYKPTGTGKTISGLALARAHGRTLWLAHREELIDQPLEALRELWPEAEAGVVKAERNEPEARDLVFASVQTACRPARLAQGWGEPFRLVVVDEAHHAAAATYRRVLDHFARRDDPLVAGLTATPTRADRRNLAEAGFTAFAYRMTIAEAIRHGFLVPFATERIVLPKFDASRVAVGRDGDYQDESLGEELERAHAAEETARAVAERCGRRKTLIFAPTVELARRTSEELQKRGEAAAWVCGETPAEERRRVLRGLRSGEIRRVANCSVLTEGFDDPSLEAGVIARITKSRALLTQMVGRILRKHPGKRDALILDVVGAGASAGGLQVLSPRLALPTTAEERRAETEGLPVLGEFGDGEPCEPESREGEIVHRFVEAAASGEESRTWSAPAGWVEAAPQIYALPIEDGGYASYIALVEDGGEWQAEFVRARGGVEVVAHTRDASLAQGIAEDRARRIGAAELSAAEAIRRSGPPAPAQFRALRRLGVFCDADITSGEASDLEVAAVVRRRYRHLLRRRLLA